MSFGIKLIEKFQDLMYQKMDLVLFSRALPNASFNASEANRKINNLQDDVKSLKDIINKLTQIINEQSVSISNLNTELRRLNEQSRNGS